jgi:hypothetical protein
VLVLYSLLQIPVSLWKNGFFRACDALGLDDLRAAVPDLPGARLGRGMARHISRILGRRCMLSRAARRGPPRSIDEGLASTAAGR